VFGPTSRSIYHGGKDPDYPLNRRLGGPQSRSGRLGEEIKSTALSGNRNKFLGRPASSLVTVTRVMSQQYPLQSILFVVSSLYVPAILGLQEVEAPRFLDNRHMKVIRLSALRTGRLYPPGKIPGTHFS
jgi:hypothetical protein